MATTKSQPVTTNQPHPTPEAEEVFRRWVRLVANKGDTMVLGYYRESDWGDFVEGKKVRPYKTERHNLNSLLRRPVIVNKKENRME